MASYRDIKVGKIKGDKEVSKCFQEFKYNDDEKEEIFYVVWMTMVWNSEDPS